MKEDINNLIDKIKKLVNPLIIANEISFFLSDIMNKKEINLYEAYLINAEEIKFRRLGYIQPAWNGWVQISTCLAILDQKFLADIFNDDNYSKKLREWGIEAYELNSEKRTHYIMDSYIEYLDAHSNFELLQKMSKIRKDYKKLSFDNGPYHNEYFPYDYYSPEEILLDDEKKKKINESKKLGKEIEDLIVELNLL